MSVLKRMVLDRLLTKIARFGEVQEGMVDPTGEYMFSLGKRVARLERDVQHIERQLRARPGGGEIPQ
jgi:hypothetical protein